MSKSLDYCVKRASNKSLSSLSDRNWNNAVEWYKIEEIFDIYLGGLRQYDLRGRDNTGNDIHFNVELSFDSNADFDYFTAETCVHDGTLIFIHQLVERCVAKVCQVSTFNINVGQPMDGDKIKYTIGNLIVLNECGEKFAPNNKPWMCERATVLLPLKMEIG